jgi:hypothetical protein
MARRRVLAAVGAVALTPALLRAAGAADEPPVPTPAGFALVERGIGT